ncbi:hypothetical protein ZOSMA_378G00060 [Zostera marina]|uniref:Uncharacterized protein n=1 Tax=Zostera marina TaxID=29655 RepID=A0A0K9P7S4_ZOSMR|nr:hypothetical protein ZOSMA_378G00060 [Zostera marina]
MLYNWFLYNMLPTFIIISFIYILISSITLISSFILPKNISVFTKGRRRTTTNKTVTHHRERQYVISIPARLLQTKQ